MRTLFVLPLLFVVAACASTPGASDDALAGTDWQLRALVQGADSLISLPLDGLHFSADGTVHVRSCNNCNGAYRVDGDRLLLDGMACTRRACPNDRPELANLIGGEANFRVLGDWLIVESAGLEPRRLYFAPGMPWEGN